MLINLLNLKTLIFCIFINITLILLFDAVVFSLAAFVFLRDLSLKNA